MVTLESSLETVEEQARNFAEEEEAEGAAEEAAQRISPLEKLRAAVR